MKCRVGLDAAFIFTLHNAKHIASLAAGTLPLNIEQMLWLDMNGLFVELVLVDGDLVHKFELVATNLVVVESHGCRNFCVHRAPIRDDWYSVKDQIMTHSLRNKFGQGRWACTLMNLRVQEFLNSCTTQNWMRIGDMVTLVDMDRILSGRYLAF